MPKLKPATQAARREHILDAAEECFARSGFRGTTMQDICKAANVSAGALYLYFRSKEDLIAGIAERDRAKLAEKLSELAAAPDLLAALARLAEYYGQEQPRYKRLLWVEIGAEATRNPAVERIFRATDRYVVESFASLFARAQAEGRIAPRFEPQLLAEALLTVGDGFCWRRAVDPAHDGRAVMPALLMMIAALLNPVAPENLAGQPKLQDVAGPTSRMAR
jgi:TetR/AcrR family transcriptional repressor of uid operon